MQIIEIRKFSIDRLPRHGIMTGMNGALLLKGNGNSRRAENKDNAISEGKGIDIEPRVRGKEEDRYDYYDYEQYIP